MVALENKSISSELMSVLTSHAETSSSPHDVAESVLMRKIRKCYDSSMRRTALSSTPSCGKLSDAMHAAPVADGAKFKCGQAPKGDAEKQLQE
eukprot:15460298-Alexandrium_andersonii.AAC.1